MTRINYSLKTDPTETARSGARNLRISHKDSIEISNYIKSKPVKKVKNILKDTINLKGVIPFKKYTSDVSHKKGVGVGRYPVNAAKEILKLVENAENNAELKGFDVEKLIIKHIEANKGGSRFYRGRRGFGSRKAKSTNISIIVGEKKW